METHHIEKKRRLNSVCTLSSITEEDDKSVIEISSDDSYEDEKRELSPADSGFKEPSTSRSHSSLTDDTNISSQLLIELQKHDDKLTSREAQLRQILNHNDLINPLDTPQTALKRFNPIVRARKLSQYEVTKVVALEQLVPLLPEIPLEIEFRGVILHSWRNYDGQHLHYFVRWTPLNVLNDEWVIADYARAIGLRKRVKLSEMSMRQRRVVCERLLKGR